MSPVLYAPEHSAVAQAIDDLMNLRKILFTNECEKYLNALYQLQAATQTFAGNAYTTTNDGSLNAHGERTFYDEREWRFVPPAVADVPLLEVVAANAVPKDWAAFNRRLAANTNAHLHFTWDDMAYIQASQDTGGREQLAQLLENVQSGLSRLMHL
ncbi:abortive infection system antitoxin AbiGi family protein [Neisseriaceae bacterium B1]